MYELLYIVPAKFTEKEMELIIEKVNDLIKKQGGEIISNKDLGKKRLAYLIKQNSRGYYIFTCFELLPQKIKELNKNLKINPDILRFLITKPKTIKGATVKETVVKETIKEEINKELLIKEKEANTMENKELEEILEV